MSTRQETEETMSAVGISLEGHDYREIPDPEGDGVTRVWAKPGGFLAGIIDEATRAAKATGGRQDNVIKMGERHPSFIRGWNDLARVSREAIPRFDFDKYLEGIGAAANELKRQNAERAAILLANQQKISEVKCAIAELEKDGLFADVIRGNVVFEQAQGIECIRVARDSSGVEYSDDVPF